MPTEYYVEPGYWVIGYAEGDAITATTTISASSAFASSADRTRTTDTLTSSAVTAAASVFRVRPAAISDTASASVTSDVARYRLSGMQASGNLSVSSLGIYFANAQALMEPSLSPDIKPTKVLTTGASSAAYATIAASARYKWLAEAITSETWTEATSASDTWTLATPASETWTPAAAAADTWTPAADAATTWTEQ